MCKTDDDVLFAGVLSTYMTYKFSYRVSVIFGGVLSCVGFALSIFCSDLHELFLCIGAVAGKSLFNSNLVSQIMMMLQYKK